MSQPSQGTGTSDGALSASDKEDLLYDDDIDEARVDYASSKTDINDAQYCVYGKHTCMQLAD